MATLKAAAEKERRDGGARETALQQRLGAMDKALSEAESARKRAEAKAAAAEAQAKMAKDVEAPLGGDVGGAVAKGDGASGGMGGAEAAALVAQATAAAGEALLEAQASLARERREREQHESAYAQLQLAVEAKEASLATLSTELDAARADAAHHVERAGVLEGKLGEMRGDADQYAGTISALQAALRTAAAGAAAGGGGEAGVAEAAAMAAAAAMAKVEAPPPPPPCVDVLPDANATDADANAVLCRARPPKTLKLTHILHTLEGGEVGGVDIQTLNPKT